MRTNIWIGFVGLLILLSYVVPYSVLSNVQTWYGSFLFWSLIGVLVIVANIFMTEDFKE